MDGKYVVEDVIGEGGMALVMSARHLQLHQTVAIKLMRARALAFPAAIERFVREAQTVVRLRSENVARVMDVGTLDDGSPFMVMEHLEGVDLATVLAHRGALAPEDAVDYLLQACAAMVEAHGEGIIHRDIKPGNLFLTQRPNGAPLVKVLDFGISKAQAEGNSGNITETHDFGTMGSPPYMSPEQARSAKHVDARSDIWSMGVVLYHLISGQLPFFADSAAEVFAQILYEEPTPISDAAPWISRRLGRVIMRCLEKDPDQRYSDVTELAAALAPHASEEGRVHIDTSVLPKRRGSSLSSPFARLATPELGDDGDTEVDPNLHSVSVRQPSRLQLSDLFEELPARSLEDAYPRTTHALYTGEMASSGYLGRARRRTLWALASVVLFLLVAVAVAFVFPGVGRSWIPGLESEAAPRPAAGGPALEGAPADSAQQVAPGEQDTAAATEDGAGRTRNELAAGAGEADKDAGEAEKAAEASEAEKTAEASEAEESAGKAEADSSAREASATKRTRKRPRRSKRKTTRRTRPKNPKPPDPFGTIR